MKKIILISLIFVIYMPLSNAQFWNPYNKKILNNPYSKENLPLASDDELNFLHRRARIGKAFSYAFLFTGPVVTYLGFDMASGSSYTGDILSGALLVIPLGIALTVSAIPGILISNSRLKRINSLLNKRSPITSISVRPYCTPVKFEPSIQAGIKVTLRF